MDEAVARSPFAMRCGVLRSPSRLGSSPRHSKIVSTAPAIRSSLSSSDSLSFALPFPDVDTASSVLGDSLASSSVPWFARLLKSVGGWRLAIDDWRVLVGGRWSVVSHVES